MSTDAQTHGTTSRWLGCLCALAGVLSPLPPAMAATFPDLYTVTVDVDPAVDDRRAAAIEQGMALLLTRVTGRPQAAAYPELLPIIESAPRLVTSYGRVDSNRVRVGFNGAAVQSQLTALDWPVWGADRPQLVLWAGIDFGDGIRSLIAAEDRALDSDAAFLSPAQIEFRDGLRDELVRAADERGLPLRLPLMDATDAEQASFAAVWGGFDDVLAQASERYAADFLLIARITLAELGLEMEWELAGADGERRRLLTSGARDGIDWVADLFASQFASSGGLRELRFDIQGITSLVEYGRVMQYLGSLSIIEVLDVQSFAGDVLTLRASVRGDDSVLDRVFELGGVLRPAIQPSFTPVVPGAARRYTLAAASPAR